MKIKSKIFMLIILMIGIICISTKAQAAGASISASKTTATVGDTVTISVNINAAAWNLKVSGTGVSGGSIVGYDPEGANTSTTKTYTLNTSSAGTYTIYLKGDVTDGTTDVNSGIDTSVTVTVNNKPVTPTTPSNGGNSNSGGTTTTKPSTGGSTTTTKPTEEKKSNDSSLKGLTVEGYELYPEFNTDTHEYNIRVTNDITKLTITPTVNSEKASYKIQGATEELEVGKNVITVVVTAEDGSTTNYVVNVTRNRENLSVEHIKFFYTDENGQEQELVVTPEFSTEVFEYDLGTISYLVSKIEVDVLANLEEAQIEIIGNENLTEGENTIIITVTMPSENEEETDEVITYKVKVSKDAEPVVTFVGKIQNWFKGTTGTISIWFNDNVNEILIGALGVACVALAGLSVYIIIDYKKYKLMAQKIAELTKLNNTETIETNETVNRKIEEEPEIKPRGRHF